MSGAGRDQQKARAMTDTARPDSRPSGERETPYRYTAALAARDRGPRGRTGGRREGTFEAPNPAGPLAEPDKVAGRPEEVRAGHVPVPLGHRAARRPPAGLHRHRRLRPLQADDRAQRAARAGLRRVRAARRAVRRADRPAPADHHRGEHRDDARAAAPAGAGARPAPQRRHHRPGVLPLDAVDLPADLQLLVRRRTAGRARPIAELVAVAGRRRPAGAARRT